jgi:hypothetical protein
MQKKIWRIIMLNKFLLFIFLLFRKNGGIDMLVRLYASEIISGNITFSEVPAKLQDGVKTYLANLGLDENGNPLVTEATVQ